MGDGARLAPARNEGEGQERVNPGDWQQIKAILAGALERPVSEREAYLAQQCADPEMHKEVESLILAFDAGDSSFLEMPGLEREELKPGMTLGSYEIISLLGSGGMGEVYRARDLKLKRDIALKVLPRDFARHPNALVRFQREAHVLASLNHPNIVTIYDVGQDNGVVYIAMELVDGTTLDEAVRSGPLSPRDVLDVASQIAAGLAVAHKSLIVHRDLKPKNVMIRPDGLVKILDFGLSKLTQSAIPDSEQSSAVTVPGILLGTIDYMSPEQASGAAVDFRSDQFSLGSIAYEIATGKRPFQRGTGAETLAAIIADAPKAPRALNSQTPAALEAVIRRCMTKEPEKRYASTDELAVELREILDSLPYRKTRSGSAIAKHGLRSIPVRLKPAIAATALFASLGILAPLSERILPAAHPILRGAPTELVVLPFTNVGNDPQNQSFCDGLEEILTSKLSQLDQFQRTFSVVPSVDVLREGIVSVREARQTFGADLAITGSVQRTMDRIRLTINLVDPRSLQQLKSKTIDTEAEDVLTLQDGIVLQAADLLDVKLTSQAKQTLSAGGTTTPGAYDFYTQGRGYLQRYEIAQNVDSAISLFKLALEKDHSFALAQAALGEAYWRKYEQSKDAQWADEARKSADAAIRLNDKMAQVYVTLGMIQTGTGRYDEATQNLKRALQLDPVNSDAYRELAKAYEKAGSLKDAESMYVSAVSARPGYWGTHNEFGGFYYRYGRYTEAEKEFQNVVSLTPDNARGYSNLGVIAFTQKNYEEAARMFEKSAAIKPTGLVYSNLGTLDFTLARYRDASRHYEQAIQMNAHESLWWHNLAAAYQFSGEPQKSRSAFQQTAKLTEQELRVNPHDSALLLRLADAYSMLGRMQASRDLLGRALTPIPDSAPDRFQAAVVYEQVGDRGASLAWLGRALQAGYPRDLIERDPSLARLRLDPRYRELIGP
jgi:serine/threonine protein kinase/tetratricopeptide (TPR) repeat protein